MSNVNNLSFKDIQTVKEFFTDSQWDCIYDAVSEYQDFPGQEDLTRETLSVISTLFTTNGGAK